MNKKKTKGKLPSIYVKFLNRNIQSKLAIITLSNRKIYTNLDPCMHDAIIIIHTKKKVIEWACAIYAYYQLLILQYDQISKES